MYLFVLHDLQKGDIIVPLEERSKSFHTHRQQIDQTGTLIGTLSFLYHSLTLSIFYQIFVLVLKKKRRKNVILLNFCILLLFLAPEQSVEESLRFRQCWRDLRL